MRWLVLIFFLNTCLATAVELKSIDGVLKHLKQAGFNGAVLIQEDGKTLLKEVSGYRNIDKKQKLKTSDRFFIGSVTKHMTAAAILKLEEQGQLKTTDKLSKHLPKFPNANKITIHHLLTHTSGLWNYTQAPEAREFGRISLSEIVELFRNKPLDFEPGAKHQYSNSGYAILGVLIEKYSGKKYGQALSELLFQPLKLKDTGYQGDVSKLNIVKGHHWNEDYELTTVETPNMAWAHAAGGVYSTLDEMLKWAKALRSGKVISKKSYQKMISQCVDSRDDKYCYALVKSQWGNEPVIWHNGGFQGFNASVVYLPKKKIDIIILKNRQGGGSATHLASHFAKVLVEGKVELPKTPDIKEVAVDKKLLAAYAGQYTAETGGQKMIFDITQNKGRLYAQLTVGDFKQGRWRVIPISPKRFEYKIVEAALEFQREKSGKVNGLVLHQNGKIAFNRRK